MWALKCKIRMGLKTLNNMEMVLDRNFQIKGVTNLTIVWVEVKIVMMVLIHKMANLQSMLHSSNRHFNIQTRWILLTIN